MEEKKGWKHFIGVCEETALYVLLPRTCQHCRTDLPRGAKEPLCETCLTLAKPIDGLFCRTCGLPLPDGGAHCFDCRGYKAGLKKYKFSRSVFEYTPPVRSLVLGLKFHGRQFLSDYMARALADTTAKDERYKQFECMVAVPCDIGRLRERGYNQAHLLAEKTAELAGKTLLENCCAKKAGTLSQINLGKKERLENVKDAFIITDIKKVKGKRIIVVDDVMTTGATLEAFAAALRGAGAKAVCGLTFAREPLP